MALAAKRIPDKYGNIYSLTSLASALCMSHTWAVRHQVHCVTFEEFEEQAVTSRRYLKPKGTRPRIRIEDIPVGSWESSNIVCPKAGKLTIKKTLEVLDRERDFKLRDAYREKRK